jgi:aspartate aminotransferase-like enzyme
MEECRFAASHRRALPEPPFEGQQVSGEIRFFVPGPTWVVREVLEAQVRPMIGHRSPEFKALYATLEPRLQQVFRTTGEVLLATSSSTLVMESAAISTVASDVLNLTCGAFSERWHQIFLSAGRKADKVAVPWGEAVDPDLLRQALRRKRYEAVTITHNETSTGVLNPLAELAAVVREESDALVLVDAVSGLGGARLEADEWGLDLVIAGTQKALSVPPGLVCFTFSERAAERAAALPLRGFYTDLLRYRDKHRSGGTITTPAVATVAALDRQLDRILEEGMEARWRRHEELRDATVAWAAERGFTYPAPAPARSPTVSCLRPPAGVAAPALVAALAERGFTVGGGYGPWKPETFRIGHMGEVRPGDLEALLATIDSLLES